MSTGNQRAAYGEALLALGAEYKDIVVLDADLRKSTMTLLFGEAYPERYFEMGIAEANMTSVAAGLAQTGKIPFTNSFAVFSAGRSYDQIRQSVAIGGLNVKICGSSAGLSDFGDGATHQSVEDVAIMRALPNMTVICPVDAVETGKAVRAMAEYFGPCYIRINRNDYDIVTSEDDEFVIGKPSILRKGEDVAVFAYGYMAIKALAAAEELRDSVSARVINVSTLKPLDDSEIINAAEGCKGIVTVEEHSIIGGLGSIVTQALAGDGRPIEVIGIKDSFGLSAHNYEELLEYYGLSITNIVQGIKKVL